MADARSLLIRSWILSEVMSALTVLQISFYHCPDFIDKETVRIGTRAWEVTEPGFKHRRRGSRSQAPGSICCPGGSSLSGPSPCPAWLLWRRGQQTQAAPCFLFDTDPLVAVVKSLDCPLPQFPQVQNQIPQSPPNFQREGHGL